MGYLITTSTIFTTLNVLHTQLGKSGENIEAVIRLSSSGEEVQRLVDANGDQFVLSKNKDSTQPLEDITLLLVK